MQIIAVLALLVVSVVSTPYNYGHESTSSLKKDTHQFVQTEVKSLTRKAHVPIIKQEMQDDNRGTYHSEVKTGDGQFLSESGMLKDLGAKEGKSVVKEGRYSWTSPEGQNFAVNWRSDEKGFQAEGDHLPTSAPIPEEIRRVIELSKLRKDESSKDHTAFVAYDRYGY